MIAHGTSDEPLGADAELMQAIGEIDFNHQHDRFMAELRNGYWNGTSLAEMSARHLRNAIGYTSRTANHEVTTVLLAEAARRYFVMEIGVNR